MFGKAGHWTCRTHMRCTPPRLLRSSGLPSPRSPQFHQTPMWHSVPPSGSSSQQGARGHVQRPSPRCASHRQTSASTEASMPARSGAARSLSLGSPRAPPARRRRARCRGPSGSNQRCAPQRMVRTLSVLSRRRSTAYAACCRSRTPTASRRRGRTNLRSATSQLNRKRRGSPRGAAAARQTPRPLDTLCEPRASTAEPLPQAPVRAPALARGSAGGASGCKGAAPREPEVPRQRGQAPAAGAARRAGAWGSQRPQPGARRGRAMEIAHPGMALVARAAPGATPEEAH
mmetsp:Transcript_24555/g.70589  ORF Transcript_24555/g.70589 Transcript_24555/m.70589 type:complete len:288 (-) Transcript_24555:100-963(-)